MYLPETHSICKGQWPPDALSFNIDTMVGKEAFLPTPSFVPTRSNDCNEAEEVDKDDDFP